MAAFSPLFSSSSSSSSSLAGTSSPSSFICDQLPSSSQRDDQFPPFLPHEAALRLIDELWFRKSVLRWPQLCRERVVAVDPKQARPDSGVSMQLISSNSGATISKNLERECKKQKESTGFIEPSLNERTGGNDHAEEAARNLKLALKLYEPLDRPGALRQEKQPPIEDKEEDTLSESGHPPQKESNRPLPCKKPQLETIESGKQLATEGRAHIPSGRRRRPEQRKRTKSLTDIEYDEVKGFSELGFNFSEDELTPRMVRLVPGLRPLSRKNSESLDLQLEGPRIETLYPPRDWWERKAEPRSPKWKLPSPQEGVDMKEQLKFWARAVASTVRQEC